MFDLTREELARLAVLESFTAASTVFAYMGRPNHGLRIKKRVEEYYPKEPLSTDEEAEVFVAILEDRLVDLDTNNGSTTRAYLFQCGGIRSEASHPGAFRDEIHGDFVAQRQVHARINRAGLAARTELMRRLEAAEAAAAVVTQKTASDKRTTTGKVFFSWQSDLPRKTNWNFIEDALERAIKIVNKEGVLLEPAPDRDTKDVPGSPSISDTIFAKIRDCAVFVADMSIVNGQQAPRPTPNPNVLFEAGYALAHKGWDRVVLVANTAYGRVEDLPFDLRGRRITKYELREGEEKAEERARLAGVLAEAIQLALQVR